MKVFIGWDSREQIAYDVCNYSLKKYNSDVEVIPLKQHELREQGIYTRDVDKLASTEFTFTRFLVPYLMNYEGWAIFADCDFLWLSDVKEIFDMADDSKAVMCVQHDYVPKETVKMDGQAQYIYPRKNWSSMVLWNCSHPKNKQITPELVNKESGAFLHRFQWLKDDEIGSIPHYYNWLEGWYKTPLDGYPKVVHYTSGIPDMLGYENCDYADLWFDIKNEIKSQQ